LGWRFRIFRADRFNPVDDRLPLGRRRLLAGLGGRHLAGLEPGEHQVPVALVAEDGILRGIRRQIEAGRRLVAAVAAIAVGLEERLDAGRERVGGGDERAGAGLA
jgi:hypothetical protein